LRKSRVAISGAIFLLLLGALFLISFITERPAPQHQGAADEQARAEHKPAAKPDTSKEREVSMEEAEGSVIKIETEKGDIICELFDKQAPITAGNFLDLVKSGFYDGITFHRVEPGFVIQGGDPKGNGTGGPGFTIPDEVSPDLTHDRGVLSMAKTAMPNTAGSQFFICLGGPRATGHLDMKHAVFGRVLQGMDVVQQISKGDKMTKVTVIRESPDAAAAIKKAKGARKSD